MLSESFLEDPYVVVLLCGGYALMLILFLVQRHMAKKRNQFDERYNKITNRMKARAWDTTNVILLLAFPVVIIFDGVSFSFFLLTAILVIHNMACVIAGIYVSSQEEKN